MESGERKTPLFQGPPDLRQQPAAPTVSPEVHAGEQPATQRAEQLAGANEPLQNDVTQRNNVESQLQEELRSLRRLLDVQERERKLVAYEIHDGFAQLASAALMSFQAANQLQREDPDKAATSLRMGLQLLGDAIDEARRLISGLRPPILDELGIVAALRCLVEGGHQRRKPKIEFTEDVHFQRLAPQVESTIFRIVQEALNNARRHSRSETVRLVLREHDRHLQIEVNDSGIGFDAANVAEGHFGLESIRQRARLLGGYALIDSAPGRGTSIRVEIPLLPELLAGPSAAKALP